MLQSITSKRTERDEANPNHSKKVKSSLSAANGAIYKIFVDLDGVLVDFESGVMKLFPNYSSSDDVPSKILWSRVATHHNFFANLGWTCDGKLLWETLLKHSTLMNSDGRYNVPDILTGVPLHISARTQKFTWCRRHLTNGNEIHLGNTNVQISHADYAAPKNGHKCVSGQRQSKKNQVNVITCWSRNKHLESKFNCILIDDRGDHKASRETHTLKEKWEARGGIFIQHKDASSTIQALVDLGVIVDSASGVCEKEELPTVRQEKVSTGMDHNIPVIELLDDSD